MAEPALPEVGEGLPKLHEAQPAPTTELRGDGLTKSEWGWRRRIWARRHCLRRSGTGTW